MASKRLVLLEFLYADRFSQFRSKHYPFLLQQAREAGATARWLCCWAPEGRDSRTRYVMDLSEEAEDDLLDAVEALSPTHLMVSEKLGEHLDRRLRSRLPHVVVEDLALAPLERVVYWPASWLPDWLDLPWAGDRSAYLVDAVMPAYDSTCVPPPGGRVVAPPPVHVVAGPECVYRRPLSRSPFFRDVELPAGVRPFACSFCSGPQDVRYPFATPPLELALRQCLAALATPDRCTSKSDYVVDGGLVTQRAHRFLARILEQGFPPSRFYWSFRIDELLALSRKLEALLPDLVEAGHSLEIYNMGVESFSVRENERLNKGLRPEQIDRLTEVIERWESLYPSAFHFTRQGGFGLILFTPWTTLDDLSDNLRAMRRPGVGLEGFALTSKLQILPDAAIAELARREGLLVESFEGFHYYDSGCFSRFDQRELPWRFQSETVACLYKIACRVTPITVFPAEDELLREVQRQLRAHRSRLADPFDFFEAAIEAARRPPPPGGPEEILARVDRALEARAPLSPAEEEGRPPPSRVSVELAAEFDRLLGAGRQPLELVGFALGSVEPTDRDAARVVLERRSGDDDAERLALLVRRRDAGEPCYVEAGRFAVSYHRRTPPNSEAKRRAVAAFARLLERLGGRGRSPV